MLILIIPTVYAAGSVYRSTNAPLYPGDTFTIVIDSGQSKRAYYDIRLKISDSSVISGPTSYTSSQDDPSKITLTFKALKVGNATVTVEDRSSENSDGVLLNISQNPISISVTKKPSSGGNDSGGGSSGGNTGEGLGSGTYNPSLPKGESEEERKARELEARRKIPLVESIEIISEATRLKGESLGVIETKENTFEYAMVLPRGVDAFKLDLKAIEDSVKLDYTQMYKLDAGHDKVEVRAKATQDEIEQTFIITITKAVESDRVYHFNGIDYRLLNDEILHKTFTDHGLSVHYFDEEKDKTDYYYMVGKNRLILVYDGDNNGKWLLIDESRTVLREVLMVSDKDDNLTLVVNETLAEDDNRTFGGRRYRAIEVELSDVFTDFGYGLNFVNETSGWENDLNSIFTHAIDDEGELRLIYLNDRGESEVAYVAFDEQGFSLDNMVMPVIAGISGISSLGLLVYNRKQEKRIKDLLKRRN